MPNKFNKKNKKENTANENITRENVENEKPVKEKSAGSSEPRIIKQLVGTLGNALEEDVNEIDEIFLGTYAESENKTKRNNANDSDSRYKPHKHRAYISIGVVVLILSVIGAFSSINFIGNFMYDIADKRALKNEFALFVYPVVITDPPTFENVDNLQTVTVLSSAIWKIILTKNTENYEKNYSMMIIPAIDVEASARSIFGYGYEINHRTIEDVGVTFEYNPDINSYIVPEKPQYVTYAPLISEISNVGELYKVTVSYVAPSPLSIAGIDYENEAVKTLIYTISRSKEKMTINSIEYLTSPDTTNLY